MLFTVMKSSDGRPGYIRTYWILSQMPESDTKGIPESDAKGVIFQVMPDMVSCGCVFGDFAE